MNGRELKPCGTVAAYMRHRYHNQDPCEACLAAWAAYHRAYYRRNRQAIREIRAAAQRSTR